MSTVECPFECIWREDSPTWLEKHEAWTITMIGFIGGGIGFLLTFCLRSRCTKIKCGICGCDREPLTVEEIEAIEATPQVA